MSACLPVQTGFAGKGAVEQVALTFQAAVDRASARSDWIVLQLDVTNAFNSVTCEAICHGVLTHCPHLGPWAWASLAAAPYYVAGTFSGAPKAFNKVRP